MQIKNENSNRKELRENGYKIMLKGSGYEIWENGIWRVAIDEKTGEEFRRYRY